MSNEQRAHDITLILVKEEMKPTYEELQNGVQDKDPYSLYVKLYPQVLQKVNHDFPQ